MARTRFLGMAILSVALLATQRQAGLSQYAKDLLPKDPLPNNPLPKDPLPRDPWAKDPLRTIPAHTSAAPKPADPKVISLGIANDLTCKVYALSELGDDPSLGKWIAETIPEVIQPGSWNPGEPMQARRKINYHAPSKVLVIYHTAAVHAKVDAFLNDLKKALPQENARATANARALTMVDRPVIQTSAASTTAGVHFSGQTTSTPVTVKQAEPAAPQALGYPVAAPLKQPKHLFHFIIRYEGEGLIDANVVKFAKAVNLDNATRNTQAPYAVPMGSFSAPPMISVDRANTDGEKQVEVRGVYDSNGIHVSGLQAFYKTRIVEKFYLVIPPKLGRDSLSTLMAETAEYIPPGEGEHTGGWLLARTTPLEMENWTRTDILEPLAPGRYFFRTDVDFENAIRSKNQVPSPSGSAPSKPLAKSGWLSPASAPARLPPAPTQPPSASPPTSESPVSPQ